MSDKSWPIPTTVNEALELWDKGTPLMTLEMGGIGPGYEQCIHIGVFEIIRHFLKNPPLSSEAKEAYPAIDEALTKINIEKNLQLTGAQAGAIKSLAFHFFHYGYAATINTYKNKRGIMISRNFPSLSPAA